MRRSGRIFQKAVVALGLALPCPAFAETALVAVATNFVVVAEGLAEAFGEATGHEVRLVGGSTGKLHTQIMRGAPFDVFLAADRARPALLIEEDRASGQMTYAVGRLVLWGRKGEPSEAALREMERLAIANPALAPYGVAAMETLAYYGREGEDAPALVMGENAGQAVAMVATGNVDYGLVPLSVTVAGLEGAAWTVPQAAHGPIRQDGVLLDAENAAAVDFLAFLGSAAAAEIIEASGYEVPER